MRKLFLIVCITIVYIHLVACGGEFLNNSSTEQTKNTKDNVNVKSIKAIVEQSDSTLEQEIKTKSYSISIPKDWSYEELETGTLYFKKNDKEVGGLYIQPYYSDISDPVKELLPNHSEIIESKKLDGFFTEAQEIKLITSPPAASTDVSTENWIYIFLIKDKTTIYEIFFNTKYIDENNIIKIAKSFKMI
ncbi:MAG: hypothetical protein CVV02_06285 [Firmicutes bacterium HGW-Firmicutes-7]|nr:MAG: hypothetical protein CVV02_06285 [Firmicutes bacterium HGW-Firmicutes-7]